MSGTRKEVRKKVLTMKCYARHYGCNIRFQLFIEVAQTTCVLLCRSIPRAARTLYT